MAVLAVPLVNAAPAAAGSATTPADEKVNVTAVESGQRYRQFIVGFRPGAIEARSDQDAANAAGRNKLRLVRRLATGAVLLDAPAALDSPSALALMRRVATGAAVASVEPNTAMMPTTTPNDPLFPQQWHYSEATAGANLPDAWGVADGAGVTVAVVDTGITAHSDLTPNVVGGYDFISNSAVARDGGGRDGDPLDQGDWQPSDGDCGPQSYAHDSSWHGTHVAGTIAAVSGNGAGVAGVAPKATVVPIRALGFCGGSTSDIAEAIIWAAGGSVPGVPANPDPADVINLSLGGSGACGATYQSAIDTARSLGATVVVSAGNNNVDAATVQPASCAGVITVAATDRAGNRAVFSSDSAFASNYGETIEVSAPGGETYQTAQDGVLSTMNSGQTTSGTQTYAFYQGTSQAAPHVSGLVALILGEKDLSPDEVTSLLTDNARPLPGSCTGGCGAGLVDAAAAIQALGSTPPGESQDLAVTEVTASGSDGNVPANTRDGDFATRWSATGDGQWIQYDLGSVRQVHYVDVAWYRGNERTSGYDIQVSADGQSWQTVKSGQSSGSTVDFETYDFTDTTGRYVRIVGHGNSDNDWNSITEVKVFGASEGGSGSGNLAVSGITASEYDGDTVPANTRDQDLGTRWSAEAINRSEWIRYDLDAATSVHYLKVAWYQGNVRQARYQLQVSADGATWRTVHTGESSGTTTGFETYDFADTTARYVRIVSDGNSDNNWVSITEVEIYGTGDGGEEPPTPPPGDTAPNGVRQLYPASTNGAESWTLGFEEWQDRFEDGGDAEISGSREGTVITANGQVRMHVDAIPNNDCDGITDHRQALDQGYMCTPDDWTNWEMTGYVRVVDPAGDGGDQDWTWYGNGGRHPSDGDPCTGSAYKGSYHYRNAEVRFGKESYHMAYDYRSWHSPEGGIDYADNPDKWLGMKVVRYEFTRGGERGVRLEIWLDFDGIDGNGAPANNWQLVLVEEDHPDQEPWGEDATECNAPSDTAPMLWGGPYVVYRWDDTESQLRLMTVREIVPPAVTG